MKKNLIMYGYLGAWDTDIRDLYSEVTLIPYLKDYVDNIITFKDIDSLHQYLATTGKSYKNYIFPTLSWHLVELNNRGISSLFSVTSDIIQKLEDKISFCEYAKQNKLTKYLPRHYNKTSNRKGDETLVILKHHLSDSSSKVYKKKLCDVEDWEFDEFVVQKYVYGTQEYDATFVSKNGSITLAFAYVSTFDISDPIKSQKGSTIISYDRIDLNKDIQSIFEKFLKPCSFTGTCCFDFKYLDGKINIFEINPRLNGALTFKWSKSDLALVIRHLIQNN